jgi:hypothetical protein
LSRACLGKSLGFTGNIRKKDGKSNLGAGEVAELVNNLRFTPKQDCELGIVPASQHLQRAAQHFSILVVLTQYTARLSVRFDAFGADSALGQNHTAARAR